MPKLHQWTPFAGLIMRHRERCVPYRGLLLGAVDIGAWAFAFVTTMRINLGPSTGSEGLGPLIGFAVVIAVAQILVGRAFGLYQGRFRVGVYDEALALAYSWLAVIFATSILELLVARDGWLPETPILFRASVALALMAVARLTWRAAIERSMRPGAEGRRRVVIFGAGEAGYLITRGMLTDPDSTSVPVALLDDDPNKARRTFMGVRVAGKLDDLEAVVNRYEANLVVIAIPSAPSSLIVKVIELARKADVEVRTLPAPSELTPGGISLRDIRPINENDLLGREEVQVDIERSSQYITGKRVLVTGAGGSIGSELCRQLHALEPAALIMLDRDENGLHGTQLSIEGRALLDTPSLVVADIRDRERLFEVFSDLEPEVVFHAAALKHLTLLEQHPSEGVKTNVFGSRNVIDASLAVGAECIVNISTDKAANPTSVLGATKLLAEQVAADAAQRSDCRVVSTRFGNVLGSRGSVLPTFLEQIKNGGPVTVTDPNVTRYFMTIPEAVRLVLQAGAIGKSGEILILDMGEPVPIVELAKRLIDHIDPTVKIEFTGLRPGEKLHEILVADHELGTKREHSRIFHTESPVNLGLNAMLSDLMCRTGVTPAKLVELATSYDEKYECEFSLASALPQQGQQPRCGSPAWNDGSKQFDRP